MRLEDWCCFGWCSFGCCVLPSTVETCLFAYRKAFPPVRLIGFITTFAWPAATRTCVFAAKRNSTRCCLFLHPDSIRSPPTLCQFKVPHCRLGIAQSNVSGFVSVAFVAVLLRYPHFYHVICSKACWYW